MPPTSAQLKDDLTFLDWRRRQRRLHVLKRLGMIVGLLFLASSPLLFRLVIRVSDKVATSKVRSEIVGWHDDFGDVAAEVDQRISGRFPALADIRAAFPLRMIYLGTETVHDERLSEYAFVLPPDSDDPGFHVFTLFTQGERVISFEATLSVLDPALLRSSGRPARRSAGDLHIAREEVVQEHLGRFLMLYLDDPAAAVGALGMFASDLRKSPRERRGAAIVATATDATSLGGFMMFFSGEAFFASVAPTAEPIGCTISLTIISSDL